MFNFSISDVIEAIDAINPNSACGPDEIPVILLKKCKSLLAIPIHMIWLHSFNSGIVPNFYKLSYVTPLHKKGSHALPDNCRPISLTSHIK